MWKESEVIAQAARCIRHNLYTHRIRKEPHRKAEEPKALNGIDRNLAYPLQLNTG